MSKPTRKLKGRDFLSLADFKTEEINTVLDLSAELKAAAKKGIAYRYLEGKTLGMIFEKSSTRTRVSFEVAMFQLGGQALFFNSKDLQLGRGESIADTAKVLSRYLDGIVIRTYAQSDVEELARHADVPVINGLTDFTHPCQVLADLLTIREHKGVLAGLKIAFLGDGNNVCHSLLLGCAKMGMDISVASPPGHMPDENVVRLARLEAIDSKVEITEDPKRAVEGADVVITDVWASMGQESEMAERLEVFAPYQVNETLLLDAGPDYIFMHCLPAHRGEEVTAEVIDGPHSVVWDEAENRLHVQKALLALLL